MSILSIEVGKLCRVFSKLTSLSSSQQCPCPSGTTVVFQPETQSIRYRTDGVAPSSTVGFLVTAGTTVSYTGDLSRLQFIEASAGATLNVAVFE